MASDYQKLLWPNGGLPEDAEDGADGHCQFHGKTVERLHAGVYTAPSRRWLWSILMLAMISFRKARVSTIALSRTIASASRSERADLPRYRRWRWYLEEIANSSSKVAQSLKTRQARKDLVLKMAMETLTTLTKRMTLTEPTREAERINRSPDYIFKKSNR